MGRKIATELRGIQSNFMRLARKYYRYDDTTSAAVMPLSLTPILAQREAGKRR